MDFPRPSMSASELFGDLKDKLGFGGSVATITTTIPTMTTTTIPHRLKAPTMPATIQTPTVIHTTVLSTPLVRRALPVLLVRARADSLRLNW